MTNDLTTKLEEIKARAEAVDAAWTKVPMVDDKLKSLGDFVTPLIGVVNEALPVIRQDIPAFLRLVEVLREQRNDYIHTVKVSQSDWPRPLGNAIEGQIEDDDQAALEAMEGKEP